jgi:hypothetical protein
MTGSPEGPSIGNSARTMEPNKLAKKRDVSRKCQLCARNITVESGASSEETSRPTFPQEEPGGLRDPVPEDGVEVTESSDADREVGGASDLASPSLRMISACAPVSYMWRSACVGYSTWDNSRRSSHTGVSRPSCELAMRAQHLTPRASATKSNALALALSCAHSAPRDVLETKVNFFSQAVNGEGVRMRCANTRQKFFRTSVTRTPAGGR